MNGAFCSKNVICPNTTEYFLWWLFHVNISSRVDQPWKRTYLFLLNKNLGTFAFEQILTCILISLKTTYMYPKQISSVHLTFPTQQLLPNWQENLDPSWFHLEPSRVCLYSTLITTDIKYNCWFIYEYAEECSIAMLCTFNDCIFQYIKYGLMKWPLFDHPLITLFVIQNIGLLPPLRPLANFPRLI